MPVTGRSLVFSLKSFLGCVAALPVSFQLDLERPAWAMLTAYIVAQPYAGMVQSKALYRIAGTVGGGIVSVLALGRLSSAPELLTLTLAAWLGFCVYLTLIDRTARSYAFMLAGYTAAIISFPSVDAPGAIFETAVARCEEIIVGIVCAVIANQLIWPQSTGAALTQRLRLWLEDARRWAADVLLHAGDPTQAERLQTDRNKLLNDGVALAALSEHALFDTPELRETQGWLVQLQRRMHAFLAVLVSTEDRLNMLTTERPDLRAALQPMLERTARRIDGAMEAGLETDLAAAMPTQSELASDRHQLLIGTTLARLSDLLGIWEACRTLSGNLQSGRPAPGSAVPLARHTDHLAALLGAFGAATAILVSDAFWVLTAWPSGSGAVIEAGVICALFAGSDNPALLALRFLTGTVIGVGIGLFYLVFILPGIDGLPLLIVALAVFYIPIGLLLIAPSQAALALPALLGFTTLLDIKNVYAIAIDTALNSSISLILGIGVATVLLRFFREVAFTWAERRLVRAVHRDLARVALGRLDRATFEARMFDRLNLLQARRRPAGSDAQAGADPERGTLAAVRLGLNLILLAEAEMPLGATAVQSGRETRAALVRLLRREGTMEQLRRATDACRDAVLALGAEPDSPAVRQAIMALGGMRFLLQAHAGFFVTEDPPVLAPAAEGATA